MAAAASRCRAEWSCAESDRARPDWRLAHQGRLRLQQQSAQSANAAVSERTIFSLQAWCGLPLLEKACRARAASAGGKAPLPQQGASRRGLRAPAAHFAKADSVSLSWCACDRWLISDRQCTGDAHWRCALARDRPRRSAMLAAACRLRRLVARRAVVGADLDERPS